MRTIPWRRAERASASWAVEIVRVACATNADARGGRLGTHRCVREPSYGVGVEEAAGAAGAAGVLSVVVVAGVVVVEVLVVDDELLAEPRLSVL